MKPGMKLRANVSRDIYDSERLVHGLELEVLDSWDDKYIVGMDKNGELYLIWVDPVFGFLESVWSRLGRFNQ
jgi:hypothetical protein